MWNRSQKLKYNIHIFYDACFLFVIFRTYFSRLKLLLLKIKGKIHILIDIVPSEWFFNMEIFAYKFIQVFNYTKLVDIAKVIWNFYRNPQDIPKNC